jgi:MoaA/NifB/PqqE/SkfB family radical SAM enzyme
MGVREREIAQRIFAWSRGKKTPPYEVGLSPTNNCNLACLPCVARGRPTYEPEQELDEPRYMAIVREAGRMGVCRFDICGGGEPFCRSHLTLNLMKEIKRCGMEGSISTNGTLLTESTIKTIVKIGWDEVRFSINGPNAEIDDHLRGLRGAFDRAVRAIKLFNRFKKEFNQTRPHIHLTPIVVSLNYDKMCDFVKLAHRLHVNTLILQPFMSEILPDVQMDEEVRKKLSQKLKLTSEQGKELHTCLAKAKRLARRCGLFANFDFLGGEVTRCTTDVVIRSDVQEQPEHSVLAIPCYSPWWLMHVDAHGLARPCARAEFCENLREKSLDAVWNGDRFDTLRQMLARGEIPPWCRTCCAISVDDTRRFRRELQKLIGDHPQEIS